MEASNKLVPSLSKCSVLFQAREFKAQPMKDLTPILPQKHTQPPTKPVPFELEVDVRGAVKAQEFKKQVTVTHCDLLWGF